MSAVFVAVALLIATFIDRSTATATGLLLPWVQGDLGLSGDQAPAVTFSYYGALYVGILLAPWLLVRFGRPRYLVWSIAGYGVATLLCASSTWFPELVAFRVVQGVTEGGFFLCTLITIFADVPAQIAPIILLVYAVASQWGSALAPFLTGAIVDDHSWRAVYVVFGVAAVVSAAMLRPFVQSGPIDDLLRRTLREKRIDAVGLTLLALAVAAYSYLTAFGELRDWLNSPDVAAAFTVFVAGGAGFVLWELYGTRSPIVFVRDWGQRDAYLGVVLGLAAGFPLFGVSLHLKYMQELLGFPLSTAGLVIALRALALVVSAPLATVLTFRGVDSRLTISSGFAICAIAFAWETAGITTTADLYAFVWPELLIGVGFGLIYGPLLATVATNLPAVRAPFAIAIMNLSFVAAGSFANSWLVTIFDHRRAQHLADLAGSITLARAPISAAMRSPSVAHQLGPLVAQQAAVLAFADAALCVAGVAAMAIPFALLLRRANPGALHVANGDDATQPTPAAA